MSKPVDEAEVEVGRRSSAGVAVAAEEVKEETEQIEVEVVEAAVESGKRIDPEMEGLYGLGRVGR